MDINEVHEAVNSDPTLNEEEINEDFERYAELDDYEPCPACGAQWVLHEDAGRVLPDGNTVPHASQKHAEDCAFMNYMG